MNNPPKTKICVITAIDTTMSGLIFAQLQAARKQGFSVHGICTMGDSFQKLTEAGIVMHPVTIKRKISPFSDLKALWKMYRCFKKEKFTIVHTHTPKCSLLGQLAAKFAGVPVIINTVHGFYFHEYMKPLKRFFYITMEWIAARCSTMILSQNSEDIETAIKLNICKKEKIKLLGNGVDLEKFNPGRFDGKCKKKIRRQNNIPENAVVVGIIGRLVREKGFLELFQAVKKIISNNKNVWLVIIGPEEPEKTDGISGLTFHKYGIEERTIWLGKCDSDKIPELLTSIDIYALPSWREGFPRSAIEAAAMGLPIVATNIRGCRQVVTDGETGFLVPLKNIEKLQNAINTLVQDEQLRKTMGQAGYKKARAEFNERNVCRLVINTYNNLLSEK